MSKKKKKDGRIPNGIGAVLSDKVDPFLSLAQAIVYQAVLDWRAMDRGARIDRENYRTLRNFFLSPWCDTLLLYTDIDPIRIVKELEKGGVERGT